MQLLYPYLDFKMSDAFQLPLSSVRVNFTAAERRALLPMKAEIPCGSLESIIACGPRIPAATPSQIELIWSKIDKPLHQDLITLVERHAAYLIQDKSEWFEREYHYMSQFLLKPLICPFCSKTISELPKDFQKLEKMWKEFDRSNLLSFINYKIASFNTFIVNMEQHIIRVKEAEEKQRKHMAEFPTMMASLRAHRAYRRSIIYGNLSPKAIEEEEMLLEAKWSFGAGARRG